MGFKKQHIYYLISSIAKGIKESIVPLIIIGAIGSSRNNWFLYIGIIIVISVIIRAILSWNKEVYKITNEGIEAKKGVFVIKEVSIPFNKVQSIDVASSFFQRLFDVCKVEIDTSGGDTGEKEFQVIISTSESERIKKAVFREKDSNLSDGREEDSLKKQYKFTFKDMAILSLTSMQIGIGVSIILGAIAVLEDYIPDSYRDSLFKKGMEIIEIVVGKEIIYKIISLLVIVIVLAFLLSVIGTFIRYYNFSINRKNHNLSISYGLLNIKKITIPINKILYIDIEEGIVRKVFGLCSVKISSIGYGDEKGENSMLYPLVKKKDLEGYLYHILPEISLDYKIKNVDEKSFLSYVFINIWFFLVVSLALSIIFPYGYISVIVVFFSLYVGVLKFKENGIDYSEKFLYISIRKIALHTIIVPKSRIQSVISIGNYIADKNKISAIKVEIQDKLVVNAEKVRGLNKDYTEDVLKWFIK